MGVNLVPHVSDRATMRVCEAANLTIADLPADSAHPDHQAGRVPILTGDRRTNDGREASPPRSVHAVVRRAPTPPWRA